MPQFLSIKRDISLAYHKIAGKAPGVVFCGGFMSDMNGTKALLLENFCRERGQAFVRFNYRGHGQSSGKFVEGNISFWTQDALTVFDALTDGPQILVGSSMGGWIATLVALARQQRVAALIGIAAAPDFTEDLIWQPLAPEEKVKLLQNGVIYEPSDYGYEPCPITLNLIEDGRNNLLLRAPISFAKPVRLLHGMQDRDVPWQCSVQLAEKLQSNDVRTILIKDGEHRLSREQDLLLLQQTISEFF